MTTWEGIVGARYTRAALDQHGHEQHGLAGRAGFVVLHNTSVPIRADQPKDFTKEHILGLKRGCRATLKLHPEALLPTHKSCPGTPVVKARFVNEVPALLAPHYGSEQCPHPLPVGDSAVWDGSSAPFLSYSALLPSRSAVWELRAATVSGCSALFAACSAVFNGTSAVLNGCSAFLNDCSAVFDGHSAFLNHCSGSLFGVTALSEAV